MKKQLNKSISLNVKSRIKYEGRKLATQFSVKDKTKLEHTRDPIFSQIICPN